MTTSPLFSAMFSYVGLMYGIIIPMALILFLVALFIPALLHTKSQPHEVAQATYCYLMQGIGVLLMTVGAIPTLMSVLAGATLAGTTYVTLLVMFAVGGALFIHFDGVANCLNSSARAVPAAIFLYTFKVIGLIIVLSWTLSVIITLINGEVILGWWVMPVVMIGYGSVLMWCTRFEAVKTPSFFETIQLNPRGHSKPITRKKPHSTIAKTTGKPASKKRGRGRPRKKK